MTVVTPVTLVRSAPVAAAVALTPLVVGAVAAVALSAAVMLSVLCDSVRQHTYYEKANQG